MTNTLSSAALTALGLALVAGTSAADAQTVITRDISGQPVATVITQQPVQTVTTETTRTVRPNGRVRERRVVTTTRRTVVNQAAVPAQPLYDVVTPAPAPIVAPAPVVTARPYGPPLYDTVAAPTMDDTLVNAAVAPIAPAPAVPAYRYVYQPDRILVIDPVTNIAVQSIPR
jgi:hypothetical protein